MYNDYIGYTVFFLFAVVIFNSVYETGYIENDTRTILREDTPTLRLKKEDYTFFKEKYYLILFLKVGLSVFLLFLVNLLADKLSYEVYILRYIVLLIGIRFFFYLHNVIRNRINILTFFSLSSTKYIAPLFLLLPWDALMISWMVSLFLFPIVRTMEHATKKKYELIKWIKFVGHHDLFRIKYYGFILLIFSIMYIFSPKDIILTSFILFIYFLIFRISSYILVKKKIYKRTNKLDDKKENKC
jgi:hypothetical protein